MKLSKKQFLRNLKDQNSHTAGNSSHKPEKTKKSHGFAEAKKALGQNFLTNTGCIECIAHAVAVSGQHVVEVGSGRGALTQALLMQNPQQLDLIELDTDLIPHLQATFGTHKHVKLHHTDVLKWDPTVLPDFPRNQSGYRVFGNIPYYITSPILHHFCFEIAYRPTHMVIMMQREVADKILERSGHHSVLSLDMHLACRKIIKLMDISPGSFSPPPKVHSSVLVFELTDEGVSQTEHRELMSLIRHGFSNPRKKLLSNLSEALHIQKSELSICFEKAKIPEDIRAEKVGLTQWKTLRDILQNLTKNILC